MTSIGARGTSTRRSCCPRFPRAGAERALARGRPILPFSALSRYKRSNGRDHDRSSDFHVDARNRRSRAAPFAQGTPTQPWVYVSLERENKLDMFKLDADSLAAAPAFRKETLAEPGNKKSRQAAGTVHVHPNGRFVYGVNRADTTT